MYTTLHRPYRIGDLFLEVVLYASSTFLSSMKRCIRSLINKQKEQEVILLGKFHC